MNLGKKGITLLALVITIIIMLLLAGVVMQMALGENGLFVKATQSKQEQAKSELYETAKLEYLSLKTKAIEQGQQDPPVNAVLSSNDFLAKYTVDGSNIKDKKGDIIDTRDNLLDKLEGMSSSDVPVEPSPQTYPEQTYPKTIDGVTIQEQDKDKLILKIKIKEQTKLAIRQNTYIPDPYNVEVEWGNWGYNRFKPGNDPQAEHEYYPGEFTMKIKGAKSFSLENPRGEYDKFEVTVLNWGNFENDPDEQNNIRLYCVKDIKMPEPNDVTVEYNLALISNIPEDLFKYKPIRKKISFFNSCPNITSIPENLYKYNSGMTEIYNIFNDCNNLTTVPEGLFKYNKNLIKINAMFSNNKISSIPENLFKYNTKLESIRYIFSSSPYLRSIPENLFKYNKELTTISNLFQSSNILSIPENLFKYNTKLKNINSIFHANYSIKTISENLFKHNTEVENFEDVFNGVRNLEAIPENLFQYNKKVISFKRAFGQNKIKTIPENLFKNNTEAENFEYTFIVCREIETIPENLFKYNTKAKSFMQTFYGCEKLNSIPNLFQYNINADNFRQTFAFCTSLTYLSLPGRCYSLQESQYRGIFAECRNANNYSSIPESWKQ